MACSHLVAIKSGAYVARGSSLSGCLDTSRIALVGLAHLTGMNTHANTTSIAATAGQSSPVETTGRSIEPVLTLAQIAEHLGVSVQALYDLRNKGRGPRGFKVGRHLHFRVSEVDAWLRQLESEDSNPAAADSASAPAAGPPTPQPVLRAVEGPPESAGETPSRTGPADVPTPASSTADQPSQELAGDQWALLLDLPYPEGRRGSGRRS